MKRSSLLSVLIVSISLIALWGCPKKAEMSAAPEAQQQEEMAASPEAGAAGSEEAAAMAEKEAAERAAAEREMAAERERAAGLQPVYFDFDRSLIRDDARDAMKANAAWLKANPGMKVRIEGNCDERGTREYNQALGQRRAMSAKKYLTYMGISPDRVLVISYGKEKPVCEEETETCWQKNRRDDFVAVP